MTEPAEDRAAEHEGAELAEATFEVGLPEVEDILRHREAHADQRTVDETVEGAVDLVPGEDQHGENRDPLERLLDQWRADDDRHHLGNLGTEGLFDCKLEEEPGGETEQDGPDRAPSEAGEHGTERFGLVAIETQDDSGVDQCRNACRHDDQHDQADRHQRDDRDGATKQPSPDAIPKTGHRRLVTPPRSASHHPVLEIAASEITEASEVASYVADPANVAEPGIPSSEVAALGAERIS